jgi:hypothetical protein
MTKRLAVILGIAVVLVWLVAFWIGSHQTWIGEQPGTANYVHKTVGLLTDLPHSTVEIFWSLMENIVVFSVLWAFGKNRLHRQIDAEHGYHHDADGDVHKLTEDCDTE